MGIFLQRYVIQNIGLFRLIDNWTEWSSIQGTILGEGRLWKYILQTTRFLRNKKLVPERGLHIPHRILKSELFPLPMEKNSKRNIQNGELLIYVASKHAQCTEAGKDLSSQLNRKTID